jgi:hypothetical protein
MGDYCAFFCLFYVLFLICLFKAEERGPYLPLAGLCVGLGFLVYSFHAVQMLAVMGVYLILTGLYRKISIGKYLGFAAGCLLPILGWVVWRGSYPDGVKFMTESFTYDLISHTTREVEGHVGPTDYYLSYLGQHDLFLSLYFILAHFLYFAVVGFKADFKNKGLTLLSLSVLIPMGLFSVARSKLGWYLDPIYPSLAVLIGWVSFRIFRDGNFRTAGKSILLFLLVVALLRSEREIWKTINFPDSKPSQNLLADLAKTHPAPGLPIWGPVWFQADQFMAEVVCQLNPLRYGNLDEVLSQKGYLMLEKDLKNQNSAFVQAHHLVVFLENDEWMLIKL